MSQLYTLIIPALTAVAVAVLQRMSFAGKRSLLHKDMELYNLVDDSFKAKAKLKNSIEKRLTDYSNIDVRRNAADIIIGLILLVLSLYLTAVCVKLSGWWLVGLILTLSLLLISIFGIAEGIKRVERDEKGRPLTK